MTAPAFQRRTGSSQHRRLPLLLTVSAALSAASVTHDTRAADHNDPIQLEPTPDDSNDPAADIADIFAWNGGTGEDATLNLALTWRADPDYEVKFDPTIQFTIHLLVDDPPSEWRFVNVAQYLGSLRPQKATHEIRIQFGVKGEARNWREATEFGVRVLGLPGHDKVLAPVGQIVELTPRSASGSVRRAKLLAGVVDDSFFADKDGFFNAISTTLGNQKLVQSCVDRFKNPTSEDPKANLRDPFPGKVVRLGADGKPTVQSEFDCNNATSSWPNYPLAADRPFGFNNKLDGFGLANMHGVILEIPVALITERKDGGRPIVDAGKVLHVWATSEGKANRPKSGTKLEVLQ